MRLQPLLTAEEMRRAEEGYPGSLDELMERVREAIALCLEVQADETGGLEFVGVQRVRVPA